MSYSYRQDYQNSFDYPKAVCWSSAPRASLDLSLLSGGRVWARG